ncbi:MAG: MFS transporter [Armatimonadota bacterium]|nr:MFS transporter [bacterium]
MKELQQNRDDPGGITREKPWHGPEGLRAFRHRNFTLYWIGQVISFTGTWVQTVAQGWLVLKLTGSALDLGIVGAANTFPVLLLGLPAGAIADRLDKRRVVIVTQTLAMMQAFALAALTFAGVIRVWHVIVLAICAGAIGAFDNPIRQSMLVELVDGNKDDILSCVSLSSTAFNGARVLGPALAGVTLVAVGIANCFFINAISYIAALIALLMMKPMHSPSKNAQSGAMLSQIWDGLSHAWKNELLRDLLLMSAISGVFGSQINTVMPVFADKVFRMGPKGLGVLMAAIGIGALFGAVINTVLGHRFRQRTLVFFGGLLCAASLLAFSRSGYFHLATVFLALTGLGTMLFMTVSNTIIQEAAPDSLRGRVISVRIFVLTGLAPVGALLIGFLAERFGVQNAVTILGAASLASAIYFTLRSKAIRSFE